MGVNTYNSYYQYYNNKYNKDIICITDINNLNEIL